jgi:cell division protein FtsI/penicillin-binding protein 2
MMKEVSADVKTLRRLKIVALTLFAFGVIVGVRLFQLQILQHHQLSSRSEQQYLRTLRLEPKRGTIYDRNMKELAVSVPVSSLYANPAKIPDARAAAARLSPILGIPTEELAGRLGLSRSFVWVQRKMTPAQADKIASLNLPGLGFVKENKRYYPKRSLAAQILGFVGTDNRGLEGLEFMYDKYVGGNPSLVLVERDAKGRNIIPPGAHSGRAPKGLTSSST